MQVWALEVTMQMRRPGAVTATHRVQQRRAVAAAAVDPSAVIAAADVMLLLLLLLLQQQQTDSVQCTVFIACSQRSP